ncbi:adenylate/guanylate cyclase domain-containing protein [Mycolicibacterium celeriflavum]|uniref:adenylate/guanylate cyclase domain-containing protein n=1 Tax=Mycolicibacterium celeriflavum TaxID=1249101 RepID=UPI000A4C2B33|nr:adenylate/guanylate cyclase domain-containing protein [Mycolicibacterium celeriflavum]
MIGSPGPTAQDSNARVERGASIDELLDRAVGAINRGDRAGATALAGQVLAVDNTNAEAEDLLAAPCDPGEIRRLTIFFADLVDSTALSTRVEPETYRLLVGRYREQVLRAVTRYEGHIGSTKGDGLLAMFGHPIAHEDDARRAVQAGLEITREVAELSEQARRRFGIEIAVRVGVHHGLVYLDTAQADVYGLAANLAARVSGLAPPGSVVVSDAVETLTHNNFEFEARPAALVKGFEEPIAHYRVVAERARTPKSARGPLVGCDSELAHLEQIWAQARAGTLRTPGVVFQGEPGIGKSRLAAAATELAETCGSVVLELIGSPFHTDTGLHPVRTLLERRCGIDRSTDQTERLRLLTAEVRARELDAQTTVPLLAPVLGIEADTGYEQVAAEGRKLYELISQAVHAYLLSCVDGGAGLVVAEDVHWFDASTRDVLGALLDARSGRLMVVVTGRGGEWLPSGWSVKVFHLMPLTDKDADSLITALNPGLAVVDRAAIRDRCDGVPFYIEQVVAGLTETGVPEALYEPLFARLRATANVVPVVEAAAVIGRDIDRGLLRSVVDISEDGLNDVLGELEDALVLEPSGTDNWRFRHELLREVATESAPPSVRRALHARVADALVGGMSSGEPDWGLVAVHYERAERHEAAAVAYQHASEAARRRGALAEARNCLGLALAGLDRAAPSPARDRREMALRLRRGSLPAGIEGYQSRDVAADFERCLQVGGTDLRDDELAATLVAVAVYFVTRADLRRAVQVFESMRAGLEKDRQWFRAVADGLFGVVACICGEFDAARSQLEHATKQYAAARHDEIDAVWYYPNDPIVSAHLHLALAHLARGDLYSSEDELAHAAQRTEQLGFPQGPFSLAYARFVASWMRMEAGQFDHAAALAAEVTEQAQRHGFDLWLLIGGTQQSTVNAVAALGADNHDPAGLSAHISTMTTLVDTWRAVGLNVYVTFFDAVLGRLLIVSGQLEAARHRLDIGLQLARDTGMCFYDAELLRLRARTHASPEARQADIDAAVKLARHQGATIFELRGALNDFELRGQPARAALIDAASRIPTGYAWPELARARAALTDDHEPSVSCGHPA